MGNPDILIYTDGSSRGNPGPGGYGIIIQKFSNKRSKEISRGLRNTTNKTMELLAEKQAIKNFKGKKNSDLWKSFLGIYPTQKIKFFWIKGHNNHPQNERCDHLAFEASKSKNLDIDHEYEKE